MPEVYGDDGQLGKVDGSVQDSAEPPFSSRCSAFFSASRFDRPARTVIWIVAGLLVAWFYIAYEAKLKRFEPMLKQVEAGDRAASPTTRVDFQLAMLRSQARSFVNFAVMGAVIVVASIPVSFLYSAGKRAGIIAGMVAAAPCSCSSVSRSAKGSARDR